MITQELLEYVRTEVAKGKTREEIHKELSASGGWSENDLSEAFRAVVPMQTANPSESSSPDSLLKSLMILIIIGGLGFGFWYYRLPIKNFWNSLLSVKQTTNKENTIVTKIDGVKNCGIGTTPKLETLSAQKSDPVLSCLGSSALACENAKGILKDDSFPTIFEITKLPGSCNFKLSYSADSTLAYVTGQKLAGQYISCPINIVKAISNPNTASQKFSAPDKIDLSKYASQIYLYGTLGLFIENNFDQKKIQNLGCSGEYVQSVIASYSFSQKK